MDLSRRSRRRTRIGRTGLSGGSRDDGPERVDARRRSLLRVAFVGVVGRAVTRKRAAVTRVGQIAKSCRPTTATAVGESYRDLDLRRSAISDGLPGSPLDLDLSVVDGLCRPVANVDVDVWHCDVVGIYSEGLPGPTFGRGRRFSDAGGRVRFTTIWPGWYATRAVHLHVRVATPTPFATQLFLPDAENERIRHLPDYAVNTAPVVSNTDDPYWKQLGGSTLMTVSTVRGRPTARYTIAVSLR